MAPTAKNLQEQHVYVVQSVEGLAKVDALTPCRYGAPTMLIVAFDKNNVFTYPGQKYDSGIIKAHFNQANDLLVQLIVSMPALLIIVTNHHHALADAEACAAIALYLL